MQKVRFRDGFQVQECLILLLKVPIPEPDQFAFLFLNLTVLTLTLNFSFKFFASRTKSSAVIELMYFVANSKDLLEGSSNLKNFLHFWTFEYVQENVYFRQCELLALLLKSWLNLCPGMFVQKTVGLPKDIRPHKLVFRI